MADLSEEDRKAILGKSYLPPDPNAPAPPKSWLQRTWASLTGKPQKA